MLRTKSLALALALLACVPAASASAEEVPALRNAKSWGYNLSSVDAGAIAQAPYDVFVIDYSRDGTQETAFAAAEIAKLKVKPDGSRRIVLSYLSIGEAEKYRYYWKWYWGWFFGWFAPAWRGPENKEWRGNFGVRYWNADWQKIIFTGDNSYLDRIIAAGFDGVYLDKIDEYVDMRKEKNDARALMIALVTAIAKEGRARKPGFFIVPQNGEALLTDASYRAVIDGLGKEDLLYGDPKDKRANNPQTIARNVAWLKLLTGDGKPVFAVEYLDKPEEIERAKAQLLGYGLIPHFADRGLDTMRIGDLPGGKRRR
jgi:cysteinyl-tRNA synthetase